MPERFWAIQGEVSEGGVVVVVVVVAGELFSPLKMLHVLMGPQDTTYFLMDYPERAAEFMAMRS